MKAETSILVLLYDFVSGTFELVSGIVFLSLGKTAILHYEQLIEEKLLENSYFLVATVLEKVNPFIIEHSIFLSLVLMVTGLIKLISGVGLFYNQLWAEHLLVAFMVVLIPFDLLNFYSSISFFTVLYMAVHILIILYLVEFKPHHYTKRLIGYYREKR